MLTQGVTIDVIRAGDGKNFPKPGSASCLRLPPRILLFTLWRRYRVDTLCRHLVGRYRVRL